MDDIYGDLENYNDGNVIEELRHENEELKFKLKDYASDMDKLQKDYDKISSAFKTMETNFSSLLRTARAEIERKTQIITTLNTEKDMLVLNTLQNSNKSLNLLRRNIGRDRPTNRQSRRDEVDCGRIGKKELMNLKKYDTERGRNDERRPPSTDTVSSGNTDDLRQTASVENMQGKYDSHSKGESKENVAKGKKEKAQSIKNRRKSMPVVSKQYEKCSSDEEDCPPEYGNKRDRFAREDKIRKTYDRHKQSHKISETSGIDEKYSSYHESSRETYYKEKSHRYSEKNRDPRKKRHFTPDKSYCGKRDYREDQRQEFGRHRILESPPLEKPDSSRWYRERRSNYEKEDSDAKRPKQRQERPTKHLERTDSDEPKCKRARTKSYSKPAEENIRLPKDIPAVEDKVMREFATHLHPTSCQSPDNPHVEVVTTAASTQPKDKHARTKSYSKPAEENIRWPKDMPSVEDKVMPEFATHLHPTSCQSSDNPHVELVTTAASIQPKGKYAGTKSYSKPAEENIRWPKDMPSVEDKVMPEFATHLHPTSCQSSDNPHVELVTTAASIQPKGKYAGTKSYSKPAEENIRWPKDMPSVEDKVMPEFATHLHPTSCQSSDNPHVELVTTAASIQPKGKYAGTKSYSKPAEENIRWPKDIPPVEDKVMPEFASHLHPTSCQSPDNPHVEVVTTTASTQPTEIMNSAASKLEDPRLSSTKYVKTLDGGKIRLITATGRNVDLNVIDTSTWDIERVVMPEALQRAPPIRNEYLQEQYLGIDPVSNMSVESGEIQSESNDTPMTDYVTASFFIDYEIERMNQENIKLDKVFFEKEQIIEPAVVQDQEVENTNVAFERKLSPVRYKIPRARPNYDSSPNPLGILIEQIKTRCGLDTNKKQEMKPDLDVMFDTDDENTAEKLKTDGVTTRVATKAAKKLMTDNVTTDKAAEMFSTDGVTTEKAAKNLSTDGVIAEKSAKKSSTNNVTTEKAAKRVSTDDVITEKAQRVTTDDVTTEKAAKRVSTDDVITEKAQRVSTDDITTEKAAKKFSTDDVTNDKAAKMFSTDDVTTEKAPQKFSTDNVTTDNAAKIFNTGDVTSENAAKDKVSETKKSHNFERQLELSTIEIIGDLDLSDDNSDNLFIQMPAKNETVNENDKNKNVAESKDKCKDKKPKKSKADKEAQVIESIAPNNEINSNSKSCKKTKKKKLKLKSTSPEKITTKRSSEKKSMALRVMETKVEVKSSKFNELFGDSCSLITPEDLGVTVAPSKTAIPNVHIFEDAQDSADLEAQIMQEQINPDVPKFQEPITPSKFYKKSIDNGDRPIIETPQSIKVQATHSQVCKIDKVSTEDTLENNNAIATTSVQKAIVNVEITNATETKAPDVLRTVIISTGVQPHIKDTEKDSNYLINKDVYAPPIQQWKISDVPTALATSTPHKRLIQKETEVESSCNSSLVEDQKCDSSSCNQSLSNVEPQMEPDVPDMRIFVRRRRKIKN